VHDAPEVEPSAEPPTGEVLGLLRGMKVIWFIGLLIVGLFLSVFAPGLLRQADEVLRRSPFVSLLAGFAIFVCVPVALLFLLVVVVGWPLVLLLTTLHMLGIIFSGIFVGFTVGRLLLAKVKRARESVFWPMALGVLILVIVSSIPLIGFLLRLGTIMFGIGAISISQWEAFKQSRRRVPSAE